MNTKENIMKEVNIRLNTVNDVKMFVSEVMKYNCNFDIISDRYIVDAKSIMGIFSVDLSKPLILRIDSENDREITEIEHGIFPFMAIK